MIITDNFRVSKSHWYSFLPRKLQTILIGTGIKLGLIHRYGKLEVTVHHPDGTTSTSHGYNILTNVGLIHMSDILVGTETTNLDLAYMEPGSDGVTPVAIADLDLNNPLTPTNRLPVTSQTRSATTPYEIVIQAFVGSTEYTRPQTINELAVFFGPDETGDIFCHGLLSAGVTLNVSDTATLTYGIVWR